MDKFSKCTGLLLLMLPLLPVLALCYSFLHLPHEHSLVVVNKERVITEYIRALSQHALDEIRMTQETRKFRLAFEKTLKTYATTHHVVILDNKSILASPDDSVDVTTDVMQVVAHLISNKS